MQPYDFDCPACGKVRLERRETMYECEVCGFATAALFHIDRGSYYREVCWDCYQAFLESEADDAELKMEDR